MKIHIFANQNSHPWKSVFVIAGFLESHNGVTKLWTSETGKPGFKVFSATYWVVQSDASELISLSFSSSVFKMGDNVSLSPEFAVAKWGAGSQPIGNTRSILATVFPGLLNQWNCAILTWEQMRKATLIWMWLTMSPRTFRRCWSDDMRW